MTKLCEGLTILDLSQGMAGGLATMVLADAGAEVLKIEPPTGDWSREQPGFLMWSRGKKSVVLDLGTRDGVAKMTALARKADIFLTNHESDTLIRWGADYSSLKLLNPSMVHCSITGFGPLSKFRHLKGYDGIVNAKTGRHAAFTRQIEKDGPTYAALMCATYGAAMYAIQGIMAGLYVREQTGQGQQIQTSLAEALLAYDWGWIGWQLAQRPDAPGDFVRGSPTPQYFIGRTKDGQWLQMANAMSHLMVNFVMGLDLGDIYDDPRYQELPNISPGPDLEELYERIHDRMSTKTADDWTRIFIEDFDAASEIFRSTQEAFDHPQVIHNEDIIQIDDPTVGPTRQLGPLVKCSRTPLEPQGPAPSLGQHTDEVLSSIPKRKLLLQGQTSEIPKHPLQGVTVIDFSTWYAAPFGTAILADLGANVIKVESLDGDTFRRSGSFAVKPQQGKRTIAIDLKQPEGQKVIYSLLKTADILMHNFRPGVPTRLGIDYETVQRINPGLVYLYAGSYGSTGPSAHRPAMHPIPGAICGGALYQAGREMPPPPDRPMTYSDLRVTSSALFQANEGNPDCSAALGVATALMLGLYGKKKTGQGQYLETTMICSSLYANADDAIQYEGKPDRILPDGQLNGLHALYRFYKTKSGWSFLACVTEDEWQAFCHKVDRPDLMGDPRFTTRALRLSHDETLIPKIAEILTEKTANEWESYLAEAKVACAATFDGDYAQFANTENQMISAGLWVTVEHPLYGKYQRYGSAIRFSECQPLIGPTTYVGEHTAEILAELGYSGKTIEDLKERNIVTWTTLAADPDA